jgi:hypothetical protein
MSTPEYRERFGLLIEAYLMHCSEKQREEIFKQIDFVNRLKELILLIKSLPKDKRNNELNIRLKELKVPESFQLPLDPTYTTLSFCFLLIFCSRQLI